MSDSLVIRPFTDLVSGEPCALVIRMTGPAEVAHPRCYELADLVMGLDAFYCTKCQYNGRVSGAWCSDEVRAWRSLWSRNLDRIL